MKTKIGSRKSARKNLVNKKPKESLTELLISAIRKYSKGPHFPNGVLIIDLKSLALIGHSEMRQWARAYLKRRPLNSFQAILCDPIPPDVTRIGIRKH